MSRLNSNVCFIVKIYENICYISNVVSEEFWCPFSDSMKNIYNMQTSARLSNEHNDWELIHTTMSVMKDKLTLFIYPLFKRFWKAIYTFIPYILKIDTKRRSFVAFDQNWIWIKFAKLVPFQWQYFIWLLSSQAYIQLGFNSS